MGIARKVYYYDKRAQRRYPTTPQQRKDGHMAAIAAVVLLWPFCLCINGQAEFGIAIIWWVSLFGLIRWNNKRQPTPKS